MNVVLRVGQLLEVGREHFGMSVAAEIVPLLVGDLLYVVEAQNGCQGKAVRLGDGKAFSIVSMFTGWDTDVSGVPLSQTYVEVPL
jgi:hypothetical protein